MGYLPLSLPYNTVSDVDRYDDIPVDYTDTINFELFGNSASGNNIYGDDYINKTIYAPDVYGKRLTLAYVPATSSDSDVISEYGNIFSTLAYLVKMKPQFTIDGEVIAEGDVCNTGYTQKYNISLSNKASGQNNSEITNTVTIVTEPGIWYNINIYCLLHYRVPESHKRVLETEEKAWGAWELCWFCD